MCRVIVRFLQRRSCFGVDAPETKSPERLRGPGSGWAQCGYAVVVSTCTSFEIRIRFFLLVRKRARIVDPRITKVKKNFLTNGSLTQQNARRFFDTEGACHEEQDEPIRGLLLLRSQASAATGIHPKPGCSAAIA